MPIPNRRRVAALVFRHVGESALRSHPEGGDGREQQVPPRPVGGGFVPRSIRLRGKRTTASRFFAEEAVSGAQLQPTTAERGGGRWSAMEPPSPNLGGA